MTESSTKTERNHLLPPALSLIGTLLVANGAVLGIGWLFDGAERFSETAALWQYAAYNRIYLLVLIALVVVLPHLRSLTSPDGRRLPTGLLQLAAAMTVLQAAAAFTMGFVAPFLAEVAPVALDIEDGGVFAIAMMASYTAFFVAVVALGIVAFRRRVFPRPAALLIVLGGLLTPMFGPVGSILIGAGLAWSGLATGRRRTPELAPMPAPAA